MADQMSGDHPATPPARVPGEAIKPDPPADAPPTPRPVTTGVTEELGSEIMVIFTIDAPYVERASLAQAAEESADEDEASATLVGGKSVWTAQVSKESRVRQG
jgi:hypothetical protein